MKDFMMIFRSDKNSPKPSPDQLQQMVKQWDDWRRKLEQTGNFVATNALGFEGKTFNAKGPITDGPYAEVKEHVGGYTIVKANDLSHAEELAQDCPILQVGGSIEIRDVMVFNF